MKYSRQQNLQHLPRKVRKSILTKAQELKRKHLESMAYMKLTLWRKKRNFEGTRKVNRSERKANHTQRDRVRSRGLHSLEPAVTLHKKRQRYWVGRVGRGGGVGPYTGQGGYMGRIIDPWKFEKCCTIWNTATVRKFNTESLTDRESVTKIDYEYSSQSFVFDQKQISFFPAIRILLKFTESPATM